MRSEEGLMRKIVEEREQQRREEERGAAKGHGQYEGNKEKLMKGTQKGIGVARGRGRTPSGHHRAPPRLPANLQTLGLLSQEIWI